MKNTSRSNTVLTIKKLLLTSFCDYIKKIMLVLKFAHFPQYTVKLSMIIIVNCIFTVVEISHE